MISIQAIDALLPQTQCGKCGHPGCKPYAEGIAKGEAINKCPPGGDATIQALAQLLDVPELPLELPAVPPQIALIREAECIGCTKCIQACPVDAIVGAAKLMHTVITAECTGCELCVAPCPVDCIDILPLADAEAVAQRQRADQFRRRHEAHLARLARDEARRKAERAARAAVVPAGPVIQPAAATDDQYKRLKIEAAMAKVVLAKAEKQLAQRGNAELQRQVEELRLAAERAQQALDQATPPAPAAPTAGIAALKQAKIQFALRRAELDKAVRQGADEATVQRLRASLEAAAQALHAAEEASGKPLPDLVRTDKQPVDLRLRELKTEHAYARAELQRLERRLTANAAAVDPQALQQARQRLADAERQLHDHQQQ
ncbi:RnfABCDGE type electron transport complex subunit B [Aquipseudomonas alcaligenes]|uniref:Ion-translocating oxidoreductase complex subunit B n=1 Tax=Aquipseudomonas alcaligenes TaxID=43263 RepID=A0AB73HVC1_AQUAC|nr:RnfABCDGE type electron transport complex subunit B [Pseudomonas alcaligenes]MDH0141727.1 RnfABCDGE type electron transport complex subunit B [Pseudomonas alcaligenes]